MECSHRFLKLPELATIPGWPAQVLWYCEKLIRSSFGVLGVERSNGTELTGGDEGDVTSLARLPGDDSSTSVMILQLTLPASPNP